MKEVEENSDVLGADKLPSWKEYFDAHKGINSSSVHRISISSH